MLQDLRDTATQQQQNIGSGSQSEPFYLHDSESHSGNSSPLQQLFGRTAKNKNEQQKRSSTKSHRGKDGKLL